MLTITYFNSCKYRDYAYTYLRLATANGIIPSCVQMTLNAKRHYERDVANKQRFERTKWRKSQRDCLVYPLEGKWIPRVHGRLLFIGGLGSPLSEQQKRK